jgi:hypothetical protein
MAASGRMHGGDPTLAPFGGGPSASVTLGLFGFRPLDEHGCSVSEPKVSEPTPKLPARTVRSAGVEP